MAKGVPMPELPEVETIARELEPELMGKKFIGIEVYDPKLSLKRKQILSDSRVTSVTRIGKQVVITCSQKNRLFMHMGFHLRMSGRLFWSEQSLVVPKVLYKESATWQGGASTGHVRARLVFNKGELTFVDPRRFGTILLSESESVFLTKGIDPIKDAFSFDSFLRLLGNSSQPIKTWLLRQDKVIGIGNIYACEMLFLSSIHPERKVSSLTPKEQKKLYQVIPKVLSQAIKNCGTTFSDFQGAHGDIGSYQRYLKTYDREGLPCKACKEPILRMIQAQRSTYYCRTCQR